MVNVTKKVQIISKMCHEANRVMQIALDEEVNPPWDSLSEDLKDSTYMGVLAALDGAGPEELHDKWCEERRAKGWKYDRELDRKNKLHPNLLPYKALPVEQQLKDSLFLSIVKNYER